MSVLSILSIAILHKFDSKDKKDVDIFRVNQIEREREREKKPTAFEVSFEREIIRGSDVAVALSMEEVTNSPWRPLSERVCPRCFSSLLWSESDGCSLLSVSLAQWSLVVIRHTEREVAERGRESLISASNIRAVSRLYIFCTSSCIAHCLTI